MSRGATTGWLFALSVASLALLVAQQSIDAALRDAPPVVWVFRLVPLLLFLPGVVRDRLRSFIWLCFVSLCYFVTLVERLFAVGAQVLPIIGMLAVITLFVSAMMYVRFRARELRSA